jgi:transposase
MTKRSYKIGHSREQVSLSARTGRRQRPYDPADLLKLYLYGYLHQVRSSRRLEREVRCNPEVMWLLRGLTPGYRTIANFRKDNAAGLRAASREFAGPQPGPAGRRLCSLRWAAGFPQ